ncbi:MFS transporter [Thermolongibacillus altinsuensis]|uniref:MFS transporter n=1 Tax=Thermolongibacillus altinsuensis TaxID=575256 RepID=UPI00242A31C2|nr:MFS transporter [Thermolongibacillus altinsuensis]GMB08257.1 MFS transporter [Thermolongibacillus altinsuensis]
MQISVQNQTTLQSTVYRILIAISIGHMLNDSMQAVIPAMFPILERSMHLSYTEIGWMAFTLNMTSSVMQPVVGFFTDKKPSPYFLPLAMGASLIGMIGLAFSSNYLFILISILFVGIGSAIFHPEGSRVTFLAAGSRRGFAQSIYQVGGNTGNALAPVFTALIFVPFGQFGAIWFTALAALGLVLLFSVSQWYSLQLSTYETLKKQLTKATAHTKKRRNVIFALSLLIFLVFARSWYHAGISNYYQFYLIEHYHLSIKEAQFYLFIFMIAGAIGTFFGGPLADRFGKRNLILASTLGTAPFSIILPHLSLTWAWLVVFLVGFILSLSFSTLVIYAQELLPGNIGMASGLIVGLAFGLGAIGSVFWGNVADHYSLTFLMFICSFLPLLGALTWLLPSDKISHH